MPTSKITRKPARKPTQRTRGRPRPEDAAAIETELLDIALKEFLEHGYGGTSLTRIVKLAGVSKTTLYSRFASKSELFHAIIHRQIEQLSPATLLPHLDTPGHLEEGLKAWANHMLEENLKGEFLGVTRLIFSESHRFPELAAAAAERNALGLKRVSQFIRECADADGVACRDPDGAAEAFLQMMRGWHANAMLSNRRVTRAQRKRWVDRSVHVLLSSREAW